MHNNTYNRGQTLLEALIALTILVIILGAVATSVLTSINNSSFVKQQNQANKLAQQGMEYIRDRINNSGANRFATYTGYANANQTQCLGDINSATPLTPGSCGNTANVQGVFEREVTFTAGSCDTGNTFVNGLTVTVNVYWTSGKCSLGSAFCHRQKLTSCFIDPGQSLPSGGASGI